MSKRVIIDIDAGVDDAFALILLLEHNVDIVAITCVNGNTSVQNVFKNVHRLLKLCNRTEIPVYIGAVEPLVNSPEDNTCFFHGKDGFGDLEDEDNERTINQKNNQYKIENLNKDEQMAVNVLNKLVTENPGEISLICLGPLTNIALTLKTYSKFAEKVKEIFIMGGNHKGIGNVTSSAEFNFYTDPEAAYIVLNYSKCPITILPWEPCLDSTITFDWRYNVLGNLNHPTMNLLNAAEKNIYTKGEQIWLPCDAFLTGLFLYPELIKHSVKCNVSVELQGLKTRAQMVIMHAEKNLKTNALIITDIDMNLFKTILLKTFTK